MTVFAVIKRSFWVLLVGFFSAVSPLVADASELDTVLDRLRAAAAEVQTLQGSFVQEKTLEMFDQRLLSTGVMIYAEPDRLRWELLQPVASGFVLQGKQGVRWNAVSGQVQRFSIDSDPVMGVVAQQLLAWARVDLEWLGQNYYLEVTNSDPVELRLTPVDTAEAELIDYIEVTFVPQQGHVSDVLIMEQSGDSTRLRFNAVRINDRVAAEVFTAPDF